MNTRNESRSCQDLDSWIALLEMFSDSHSLLQGAAGEDAMSVGDVLGLVRELRKLRAMYDEATDIQGDDEVLRYVSSGNAIPVTRCTVSADLIRQLVAARSEIGARSCTCHPGDNPPRPCPQKFALSECRAAHYERFGTMLPLGERPKESDAEILTRSAIEQALDAMRYALDLAEKEEWNLGENVIQPGSKEHVGLIAVRKMRSAIAALEAPSSIAPSPLGGKSDNAQDIRQTPRVDEVAPVDAFVTDSDQWAVSKTDYDCLLDVARQLERELTNARQALKEQAQEIVELRASARSAIRAWIPVSERRPEDRQEVVGCWFSPKDGRAARETVRYFASSDTWAEPDMPQSVCEAPAYWMPLPEIPLSI